MDYGAHPRTRQLDLGPAQKAIQDQAGQESGSQLKYFGYNYKILEYKIKISQLKCH